jgi:hypothetical protein
MDWKGVGGNSRRLIEVLAQNLPGGIEEIHEKPQSGYPISELRSELSTSQIEDWYIIAMPTSSDGVFLCYWKLNVFCEAASEFLNVLSHKYQNDTNI